MEERRTIKPGDIELTFNHRRTLKFPDGRTITVLMQAPVFWQYVEPLGGLSAEKACHALWFYYQNAREVYEREIIDPIQYEGDRDTDVNFRQLFEHSAELYNVEPHIMAKFWPQVDRNCEIYDIPIMPREDRYRFDSPLRVS